MPRESLFWTLMAREAAVAARRHAMQVRDHLERGDRDGALFWLAQASTVRDQARRARAYAREPLFPPTLTPEI